MSASFLSAVNTRAHDFIDEENKQLKAEIAMLLKEQEQMKKELQECLMSEADTDEESDETEQLEEFVKEIATLWSAPVG